MSSNQYRSLQATPADTEAMESLQHMTSWARQTMTSPEGRAESHSQPRLSESRLGSLVDRFALGATAFYSGPWMQPIDGQAEVASAPETQPYKPSLGTRALQAIARLWNYLLERRAVARATAQLSQMDDHALKDIGLTRTDIGRAARHGRDWEPWR